MKKTFIFLLFSLLFLVGCNNYISRGSTSVTIDDAAYVKSRAKCLYEDDYELLWDALRNTYPYLPYLQNQGIDVEEIYARYASDVKSITNEDEFYDALQRMLSELNNFAHLYVITPDSFQTLYFNWMCNGIASEHNDPIQNILTSPLLSARYHVPDNVSDIGKSIQMDSNTSVFVQYYSDSNTLYMKIPSFETGLVERDSDLVFDSLERYPETKNIIFDVSGNPGGNGYYWTNNLVAPFGEKYKFSNRTYYHDSPIFEQYHAGWDTKPVSELKDAPEWVSELGLDYYLELDYPFPIDEVKTIPNAGSIKRWVLISRNSYSATETFANFCKTTGWATVVGTQTSGDGMHTSPIILLLPDSGLLVRMSDSVGENPDGTINAIYGTKPDITCKRGETPLNRCLEEISKEEE